VTDLRECADVLDPARREVHVPGAHRGGAIVNRAFEELERYAHAVRAADEFDAGAAVRDGKERVTVSGEIEVGHDDLRPPGVVERARDAHQARRNVRLDRDLVDGGPEHVRKVLAKRLVLADPVVVPGAPALLGPFGGEALDRLAAAAVERRQRAIVQVIEAIRNREFATPRTLALVHRRGTA